MIINAFLVLCYTSLIFVYLSSTTHEMILADNLILVITFTDDELRDLPYIFLRGGGSVITKDHTPKQTMVSIPGYKYLQNPYETYMNSTNINLRVQKKSRLYSIKTFFIVLRTVLKCSFLRFW